MSFRLSYRQDNFERGDIHFPRLLSAISQGFSHERIIDNFHNLRVIHFLRLTREYLNEFFPRKLSLSHNREESANWQDIAFRNDYKKFLTSIAGLDEGSVASLSLVACFGKTFPVEIHHGDLHNVLFLIVFSFLFAGVVSYFGIRFVDGLVCSALGILAHFFEDLLVFNPAYSFLWPYSPKIFGLGIMENTRNLFGIANSTVLIIGMVLLAGAVLVRTLVEGTERIGNKDDCVRCRLCRAKHW